MKKSAIIKQILTYCSSQWLDIWSILIYICLFHRYFQSVLKLTLFTAPLQGPLHCPVFDLSRRRRGKHGSQSRRQPWQPHDSGNGVLSEKPQEDHVLPGIEEQALPALRHLPSQRNLRQAGQHVRDKIQRLMLITVLIFLTVELYRVRYNITEALPDGSFYFNVGFIIIVIFFVVLWTDTWSWSTQIVTLNQRRASSNYSQTLEAPDSPEYSWEKTSCVTEIWRPLENRWDAASWSETSFSE